MDHIFNWLMLPFTWLDFLVAPYNFTFTDPGDFVFVTLIWITPALIILRHYRKPYSQLWVNFASACCCLFAIVTPMVPMIVVYLLYKRGEALLGHPPVVMINDPQFARADHTFIKLSGYFAYASAFAGWGLVTWLSLILHLKRTISRTNLWFQIAVFLAAWIAFGCDPGGRYAWWQD